MRKVIITAAIIAATFTTAIAATSAIAATNRLFQDDRPIEFAELPAAAKDFVKRYYGDKEVAYITLDRDAILKEYDVTFVGGTKVEFDNKGEWQNVECKGGAVPSQIVPTKIADYVKRNHAKSNIVEIKRDIREWEIKLSNGLELTFNNKFRVVELDD